MNFNNAVLTYDQNAFAQKKCAVELVKMLPITNIASFIDIGCGTGFASIEVLKRFQNAQCTMLDISDKMLSIAKNKIPNAETITANAENFNFSNLSFNLAISNLSIQWFNNIFGFIPKILKCVNYFAFSIPIYGSFDEFYRIFDKIDIPKLKLFSLKDLLQNLPQLFDYKTISISKTFPNAIEATRHFSSIGATFKTNQMTQSKIANIIKSHNKPVTINYEILLCSTISNNRDAMWYV